jgi:CheY-like chemotaxis protein
MGQKILLVDDSEELLSAYLAFLEGTTPYEVRTAASGHAALRILESWRPDIIVTDLIMPDMGGLELITHIRSQLAPPLPMIIAVSGFPELEREARRRGAQIFQAKPIDTDDLVALIESLLANREPPDHVRAHTEARRLAVAELARAAVAQTLAQRPNYPEVARLGMRLLSRYFDGADTAIFLMDQEQPSIFASSGWSVGTQPPGILGYALDVVVSGSTLIVPDLATMPGRAPHAAVDDWRLFAAVPLRTIDGLAIGALALADRRVVPFDVHDLGILEHIAKRLEAVFSGVEGPGVLEGAGVLVADSWRHCLACEVRHLEAGQSLVIALASLPGASTTPGSSREQMDDMKRAVDKLVERLPPRTALGRLGPERLAAYSRLEQSEVGERALLTLVTALEGEPRRSCIGLLGARGLRPTDGGAALLDVVHWLLDSAMARGPATILHARLAPAAIDHRAAA